MTGTGYDFCRKSELRLERKKNSQIIERLTGKKKTSYHLTFSSQSFFFFF